MKPGRWVRYATGGYVALIILFSGLVIVRSGGDVGPAGFALFMFWFLGVISVVVGLGLCVIYGRISRQNQQILSWVLLFVTVYAWVSSGFSPLVLPLPLIGFGTLFNSY